MQQGTQNWVRLRGVKSILPLGTTMLYGLMKEGKLPKPVKIGRASFWDADEIRRAARELMTADGKVAA
jgi:predicted DNA-binding transcriptional regulator AlpA